MKRIISLLLTLCLLVACGLAGAEGKAPVYEVMVPSDAEDANHFFIPENLDMFKATIVPHNAMADSLMDEISQFKEDNTEAKILDKAREIR